MHSVRVCFSCLSVHFFDKKETFSGLILAKRSISNFNNRKQNSAVDYFIWSQFILAQKNIKNQTLLFSTMFTVACLLPKSHGFLDMIPTIPFGLLSMPRAATIKKSFPKLGDHPRFELAMRVLIVFKVRRNSNAIVALLTFVYPAAGS